MHRVWLRVGKLPRNDPSAAKRFVGAKLKSRDQFGREREAGVCVAVAVDQKTGEIMGLIEVETLVDALAIGTQEGVAARIDGEFIAPR